MRFSCTILREVQADYYLQNPFHESPLKAETIAQAIRPFLQNIRVMTRCFRDPLADKVVFPGWAGVNHNLRELIQTQDLPPVYEENSCLYLFTRDNLVNGTIASAKGR